MDKCFKKRDKNQYLENEVGFPPFLNHPTILGASVQGPFHITTSTPCQDAFAYFFMGKFGVIAVADGAGSASKSEIGARTAVDKAIETAKTIAATNSDNYNLCATAKKVILEARMAIEDTASKFQCELKDLACTLIVVIILQNNVAVAHIGDGAVVAKTLDGLKIVSPPEPSEYANETTFLSSIEWAEALRVSESTDVMAIMVFTDGCQRAALVKHQGSWVPFDGFCEPLFSWARQIENKEKAEDELEEFLRSKKMTETMEDDKTLVIAIL